MRPDVPPHGAQSAPWGPRRSGATSAERGPTVRVVHGGVQYREYLNEEQHSQPGCSAGRMQLEFHHGLLSLIIAGRTDHSSTATPRGQLDMVAVPAHRFCTWPQST